MILCEGVQKRVQFLKQVRSDLQLENLDIIGRYVNKDFIYPVNGVITRAVENTSQTLSDVQNSLNPGGRLYLMKGPHVDDELKTALNQWSTQYHLVSDHQYTLPKTSHERRLLVFEKIAHRPIGPNESLS